VRDLRDSPSLRTEFPAVITSSWRSRGNDTRTSLPAVERSRVRDDGEGFSDRHAKPAWGKLIIAHRQSDLSCRLISCLAFSSSRLLECVRCLLERTYVMSVFYVYLKKSCALRCISDDVRCEVRSEVY